MPPPSLRYYNRYPGDYARDTAHLTLEEHGAYVLLMDYAYMHDGLVPLETRRIARILGVHTNKAKTLWGSVKLLWKLTPLGYRHKRIDAELAQAAERQAKGRKLANARWNAVRSATRDANHQSSEEVVVDTTTLSDNEEGEALDATEDDEDNLRGLPREELEALCKHLRIESYGIPKEKLLPRMRRAIANAANLPPVIDMRRVNGGTDEQERIDAIRGNYGSNAVAREEAAQRRHNPKGPEPKLSLAERARIEGEEWLAEREGKNK
jgi:uncharacterized protein YdaU (DUF1376 family)